MQPNLLLNLSAVDVIVDKVIGRLISVMLNSLENRRLLIIGISWRLNILIGSNTCNIFLEASDETISNG
jgi:hypothetical protein